MITPDVTHSNPRQNRATTWIGVDDSTVMPTTNSISIITVDKLIDDHMNTHNLVASDYICYGVKDRGGSVYLLMQKGDKASFGLHGFIMVKKAKLIELFPEYIKANGTDGKLPLVLIYKARELFKKEISEYSAFMRHSRNLTTA